MPSRFASRAGFSLALLSTTGFAQQLPSPGRFGILAFSEATPAGVDQIRVIPVTAPGTPVFAPVTLAAPVARSLNRRALQSPTEPDLVLVFDAVNSNPSICAPTANATGTFLEEIDLRTGVAPTASNVIALGSPGSTIPYDILVNQATFQAYVATADPVFGGAVVVFQVTFLPGQPGALTGVAICLGPPSPNVTRMVIDPVTGNLVVPLLTSVEAFGTAALPNGALPRAGAPVLTPANGVGVPYVIGTNVAVGFTGPGGRNLVFGLRSPGGTAGHSYLMASGSGGAAISGGVDPFGAGLVLAPGCHELVVTPVAGGTRVTFLLDTLPIGTVAGGGVCAQVTGPGLGTTLTVVPPPFGNPEPTRNGTGDPVLFLATLAPAPFDAVVAVGAGIVNPLGAAAVSAALPGFVDSATCDRPISMPGGPNVAVSMATGAFVGSAVVTVGPGPAFGPATLFPAPPGSAGATTLPNALVGGLLGPQPVVAQGFADPIGAAPVADHLLIGAPLAVPSINGGFPDPVPAAAVPIGGFVLVPPPAAGIPTFGPRRPVFNFAVGNPATPRVTYPGTSLGIGFLKIDDPFAPAGPPLVFVPPIPLALTSEVLAY